MKLEVAFAVGTVCAGAVYGVRRQLRARGGRGVGRPFGLGRQVAALDGLAPRQAALVHTATVHALRTAAQVDDPLDLAKLLCVEGSAELTRGDAVAARSALAEAESISARLGARAASDLAQPIAALQRALGLAGPPQA